MQMLLVYPMRVSKRLVMTNQIKRRLKVREALGTENDSTGKAVLSLSKVRSPLLILKLAFEISYPSCLKFWS